MLELIVVLIIVTIVASISVPSFVGVMPSYRLGTSLRKIFAYARFARSEAVVKGLRHRLVIDQFNGTFWLETETDPFGAPGTFGRVPGVWGRTERLEDTVIFSRPWIDGEETEEQAVDFLPDGTADESLLVLEVEGDEKEKGGLWIRALTGVAKIVEGEELVDVENEMQERR
jgi:hypothetical protein